MEACSNEPMSSHVDPQQFSFGNSSVYSSRGPQSPPSFIYVSWEIILLERHGHLTPMQAAAIPAKVGVQEGCFSLINPREEQAQIRHSGIQARYLK